MRIRSSNGGVGLAGDTSAVRSPSRGLVFYLLKSRGFARQRKEALESFW
jgi:hypothetical protein